MAEIVNLRIARKAHKRAEAEKVAAQNRTKFGQSKAMRRQHKAEEARLSSTLDGAKRETDA